jgi:hypothetical protein
MHLSISTSTTYMKSQPSWTSSNNSELSISETDRDRFWDKAKRGDPDECWPWQAYTDRDGYGRFSLNGKKKRAHRVAVRLDRRDATGKVVRHTCDNPSCVNPDHLETGTQRENMRDRDRRKRQPRGARNGQAKLTREEVVEIRKSTRSSRVLAGIYGVAPSTIRMIKTGGSWDHIG